ncbi:hypothetical protein Bca4012_027637 [Brassica carinata]
MNIKSSMKDAFSTYADYLNNFETNFKEWRLVLQEITLIDDSIMYYVHLHQRIFYEAALYDSCGIKVHQSEDAKLILSSLTASVYFVLLLEIRVALDRSLIFDTTKEVIEPEVLLYDEPTTGLDPIASTFQIWLFFFTPLSSSEFTIYDVGMKKKQVNEIPFCFFHELMKPSGFTKLNVLFLHPSSLTLSFSTAPCLSISILAMSMVTNPLLYF